MLSSHSLPLPYASSDRSSTSMWAPLPKRARSPALSKTRPFMHAVYGFRNLRYRKHEELWPTNIRERGLETYSSIVYDMIAFMGRWHQGIEGYIRWRYPDLLGDVVYPLRTASISFTEVQPHPV